ncbi:hypothetical protein COV19_07410 [Candidatus Woesearchaeota archaeon CG10_big_fil_rev_8_21_14_0_10_44_13]|nr:MAG: hypothetical protein COV19_07410 [Candidatus Woesearchaeota archaeon CG10_big_fil_rev_8_21_14_0_10_44_13]
MATANNLFLIIIDQLRADYKEHLQKCSKLLPNHAVCYVDSLPSSTESAHETISSGEQPRIHGFISKTAKGRAKGLDQLIMKLRRKELPSLASLGHKNGFGVYVIGGKEETVRVMGDEPNCRAMVYYLKDNPLFNDKFVHVSNNQILDYSLTQLLNEIDFKGIPQPQWDKKVLNIFRHIYMMESLQKKFFIMTLSSLDKLGHDYGPNSKEVCEHLKFLDNSLVDLINNKDASVIITGDHGCRLVSRYVIEPAEAGSDILRVYNFDGNSIRFHEDHSLDNFGSISDIQYDGGLLRIWFKGEGSLSEKDLSFFFKYGHVFPHYTLQKDADEEIVRLYENSKHENLGDVLVVARGDSMFCKLSWIEDPIRKKIAGRAILKKGELPIGEHGTQYSEDREVCFLSNNPVKERLNNTEIYEYINSIMR